MPALRPLASGLLIALGAAGAAGAVGLLGLAGCSSAASSTDAAGPEGATNLTPGGLSEAPGELPAAPGPSGDPAATTQFLETHPAESDTGTGPQGATLSLGSPLAAPGQAPDAAMPGTTALPDDASRGAALPGQNSRPTGPARLDEQLVLARVNGTEIHGSEFNRVYASAWKRATAEGMAIAPEQQQQLMSSVLQGMVASELLRQDAVKRGISPDPKTIDQQYGALRDHAPSPEAFEASLRKTGYTPESLRAEITNRYVVQVLTSKLRAENAAALLTTDAEAKTIYENQMKSFDRPERVHARQILRQVPRGATAQQMAVERGKIEEALARLKAGEDFAAVARQYSNDTTAASGGDIGSFPRGVAIPGFDEVVFPLKPGETSGVFETAAGYHIVQVLEHLPAGIAPFEEVRKLIIEQVTEQKFQRLMSEQLQKLSSTAKIEVVQGAPTQGAAVPGVSGSGGSARPAPGNR